ncbi:MAG: peptidase [Kiritimatiellae bacterium]|nr:peptidase [Kiritimatiellia bacterium]
MKVLFLFIDGVGIREPAPDNPVNPDVCPVLCSLIAEHATLIDACLDVAGLPQSATGQTTMFTGINTSKFMGRHCEGFPGPSLRKIIEEGNLMMSLRSIGVRCRFADAYLVDDIDDIRVRRFKSVTTVMALTRPEIICTRDDLDDCQAVTHDITREILREKGHQLETVTPLEAADHLMQVVRANDFTLFEHFQTDLAGHSRDYEKAATTLSILDQFLGGVLRLCEAAGVLVILTSDHGNIEDLSTRGHTRNPIPLVTVGPGAEAFRNGITSLIDITPRLLKLFEGEAK